MTRVMNQKDWIKLLKAEGWLQETGGKHQVKMVKAGHRPITLPANKRRDYPAGLTRAIFRQAGIDP
jgi:predicted RNA binding protein YcfA (HicA-like mRNA interferase family)